MPCHTPIAKPLIGRGRASAGIAAPPPAALPPDRRTEVRRDFLPSDRRTEREARRARAAHPPPPPRHGRRTAGARAARIGRPRRLAARRPNLTQSFPHALVLRTHTRFQLWVRSTYHLQPRAPNSESARSRRASRPRRPRRRIRVATPSR